VPKSSGFGDFSKAIIRSKFKNNRQICSHGSSKVAKKLLSHLACSQIWLNLPVDHCQLHMISSHARNFETCSSFTNNLNCNSFFWDHNFPWHFCSMLSRASLWGAGPGYHILVTMVNSKTSVGTGYIELSPGINQCCPDISKNSDMNLVRGWIYP